jgi:hypothetical protein
MWAAAALDSIDQLLPSLSARVTSEAREVHIEPGLSHTFVRLEIQLGDEVERFLMDGTGVFDEPPYSGAEISAPIHLRNSTSDPINMYRNCKGKNIQERA